MAEARDRAPWSPRIAHIILALALGCSAEPASRLNVVLITIDTLRADALSAYRAGLGTSPHIDRLAAEGVLFEHCSTSSPSTLPSHATIFTGVHPYAHGARSNMGYVLAPENRTLAEVFRSAGYETGAEISNVVLARHVGLDQGFTGYRDVDSHDVELKTVAARDDSGAPRRQELRERPALDVTRKGVDFLKRNRMRPFFLWLHYFDPHRPYAAPSDFAKRFPGSRYHAEVAYTDFAVGELVSALEKIGLEGRTLVVVTSDHGEGLGDHREKTHAFLVYESTVSVPLILWGAPDLPRGRRVSARIRTLDIAPTVLDLAGLPPLPESQGVSLVPLIAGEALPEPLVGYGESIEAYTSFRAPILRFIRIGPWKYIHKPRAELYDVDRDPQESSNLAADQPERVLALRESLASLLRDAPTAPSGAAAPVDPKTQAQLRALGYVGDADAPRIVDELATLAVSGPDANDLLDNQQQLAAAWTLLEGALISAGTQRRSRLERAAAAFAELAQRHPQGVSILRGWIDSLRNLKRYDEALPILQRALVLAPHDPTLRMKLVQVLRARGDAGAAEPHARALVEQRPCGDLEITSLSGVLADQGRHGERAAFLAERLERCDTDAVRNEYAYFLATCPDDAQREGELALRLAQQITSGTGASRVEYFDTLAAAHAEMGEFESAIATQRRAIAILEGRSAPSGVLSALRAHLELYEAELPVREP
jgi:choline-sulfatase